MSMKQPIDFYLDFSSAASRAAFEGVSDALLGLSYRLDFYPLSGLDHHATDQLDGWTRLAWACQRHGTPNRFVCETVFAHRDDQNRGLAALHTLLQPDNDLASTTADGWHQAAIDRARQQGVTTLPTWVFDGERFVGSAALPALRAKIQATC